MKYIMLVLLLVSENAFAESFKVMSYNILHTYFTDDNSSTTYKPWSQRKNLVFQVISNADPDIIGLQEDSALQVNDIANRFRNYQHVKHLTDSANGENNAIFFKKSLFSLLDSGGFRITNVSLRFTTWAKLKVLTTGEIFYIFNTHWNPGSDLAHARIESAESIEQKMSSITTNERIIFTGDLNALKSAKSVKYFLMPKNTYPDLSYPSNFRQLVDNSPRVYLCGNGATCTSNYYIDYIMTSKGTNSYGWEYHSAVNANGERHSDHNAITLTIVFPGKTTIVPPMLMLLLND